MQSEILLRQQLDDVAILVLNAPDSLNALSNAMIAALRAELIALAQDRDTRAVILRGEGRAFCAGHDLREVQASRTAADGGRAAFTDLFARCAEVMQLIGQLPQPVIAQVHGIATAAGCQLVAACDLAIAEENCRFGVNGINVGLFCSTPMVALSRAVPPKAAFELLTTGQFIAAPRAAELGLINRAVPAPELEAEVLVLARQLAAKFAPALQIGKAAFYRQLGQPLETAYAIGGEAIVENLLWDETREGIDAFLDKRAPGWVQR